jgi:hypothetical protein
VLAYTIDRLIEKNKYEKRIPDSDLKFKYQIII